MSRNSGQSSRYAGWRAAADAGVERGAALKDAWGNTTGAQMDGVVPATTFRVS